MTKLYVTVCSVCSCPFLSISINFSPFLSVSVSLYRFWLKFLSQVFLNISAFLLNVTGFVLNKTGLILNMTEIVLNMTGFDFWVPQNQVPWPSSKSPELVCARHKLRACYTPRAPKSRLHGTVTKLNNLSGPFQAQLSNEIGYI